jgi:PAS domain S-box-containing protein
MTVAGSTRNARILVVEDEVVIAEEVENILLELGYEVQGRVTSGDEALQIAAESRPDLVLMDIRLRGLRDGIQTAEELRDRYRVPVVFLSAHADEVTLRRAKRSSPYGYVVKPFKMSDLRTAVEIAFERHALEARIRANERWFATSLRSIADAVLCTDLAGNITFMNPRAEQLLECTFAEATGRPVSEVFHLRAGGSGRPRLDLPIVESIRDREVKVLPPDLVLIDRAGQERPVDVSVAPIIDDDKPLGAVLVLRDLSERKALQRRLEFADRLAALGTMAAGVAHEVNNPLAVIMANLALISQAMDDGGGATGGNGNSHSHDPGAGHPSTERAPQERTPLPRFEGLDAATLRDILDDTSLAAERVRRIVADLRSFTQPSDEDEGPIDLARALRRALQSTAHEFRHRARVWAELGPLPEVEGSELRLGQVFVNLLVNAGHAIAPGRAHENRVQVMARTDSRGWAVIEVRDTGQGIPPDIQGKIFDPFFTTKAPGLGTGLGLSVCHGIVTSLGGDITFESEIGKGTVFRVRLPAAPARAAVARKQVAPPSTSSARASILIIDDEPLVRRAIERSLDRDHDVVAAATAAEALARLASGERFDLILCDLMMPEMTGMEMAERLKREDPAVADRMVFLSGGAFTPEAAEFLRTASSRFIEKPFLPDDLRRRVHDLLREVGVAAIA